MDIVDKEYIDNHDISSITSFYNKVGSNNMNIEHNSAIEVNIGDNTTKMYIDDLGPNYINKQIIVPDNQGYTKLLILTTCNDYYASLEDNTIQSSAHGFSGTIASIRSGGLPMANTVIFNAIVGYKRNYTSNPTYFLNSSDSKYLPCIVKYNGDYCVAISITASGHNIRLEGWIHSDLTDFIMLTSSTSNKHFAPIDGVEYIDQERSSDYATCRVNLANEANKATALKNGYDSTRELYIGSCDISQIDKLSKDGTYFVVNTREGGSTVFPFILQQFKNISTDGIYYLRQTMFDPKLGIFKCRQSTDNTGASWGNWNPVNIEGQYIKTGTIGSKHLQYQLLLPYSHRGLEALNNPTAFDSIYNLVENYNGNINFPTFAVQYVTGNADTTNFIRQLVYDANIGTFKYRSKNLDTNTFDDWTPIQIPYTTIKQSSVGLEATINKAITTGCYILSNTGVINYTNYAELLIVYRYENIVYQTHYSANNSIKARIGTVKSDNTVTWNNWSIKQHTYVLFINDTKAFIQSYKDNVLTEATAARITEIITNLKYPTGYDLKLYYRINSDINAIKLNVNTFADKLIGSYFDWDTGTTKYYKISVENNAVKIETKTV